MEIEMIERKTLKEKPAAGSELGFGKLFTDYMFSMVYEEGRGWHDAKISPYEPIPFDPSTSVLHYAQGVFEGAKAFKNEKGEIRIFRLAENFSRMNRSCDRMCMSRLDADFALKAVYRLVQLEKDWIPTAEGTALYIRPLMIASSAELGVHAAKKYLFFVILSPVGAYYKHGLAPTKIYVENHYARTVAGGTGEAKCLGNYAGSIKAAEEAQKKGYDQVLWLDGVHKKYIEEVGSMNIFFVIGDEVVTPALNGSILPGITRKSCLEILRANGYKVSERLLSVKEVVKAHKKGRLKEVFGTGTAAVVSPVGVLGVNGENLEVNGGRMGDVTKFLYDTVTGIQTGRLEDKFGWVTVL